MMLDHDDNLSEASLSESNDVSQEEKKRDEKVIANLETKNVNRLKMIVFIVLFLSSIIVAICIFKFTRYIEEFELDEHYVIDAKIVLEMIGSKTEEILISLDVLAGGMVTFARFTNQTWPFVVIPDFAERSAKIRGSTNLVQITLLPVVHPKERLQWETFSVENKWWVNETVKYQETDKFYYGPLIYDSVVPEKIYGNFDSFSENITRRLMPGWQCYPAIPKLHTVNWDWLSRVNPRSEYTCIDNNVAVLGAPYMIPDPNNPDEVSEAEYWADFYSDFVQPGVSADEPMSDIMYPIIINEFDSDEMIFENYNSTAIKNTTVAAITTSIYWRDILSNVLPEESDGLVVVFESSCSKPFSYQIDGPIATYLGIWDAHDSSYDHLHMSSSIFDLGSSAAGSKYSGIPIFEDDCQLMVHIYASDERAEEYITFQPYVYAILSMMIFAFASLIFAVYDWNVENRQRIVATSAAKTGAIVSSLFPSTIQDRMMNVDIQGKPGTKNNHLNFKNDGVRNKQYESTSLLNDDIRALDCNIQMTKPMADLYPETTIFFADIAGFTAWSSIRDPCQVFTLLETLYGAFDQVASRRRVFKVETIGDCYVAAIGLPEPNERHAITMVRFASECLDKMSNITFKLETILGPDTGDLQLRVGLNSGPTTAGVLRGEKSRFQLFGDTVNTASRMESTGAPSRIHVSQKTADLLTLGGKASWLTPREDMIDAKGKGKMQTYWVNPGTSTNRSHSHGAKSELDPSDRDGPEAFEDNCYLTKINRLVDWNVDTFLVLLKKVVASQNILTTKIHPSKFQNQEKKIDMDPVDEVTEVIEMVTFDCQTEYNINKINLSEKVEKQLRDYITTIAFMYRDNAFHNFEHASHVVMSTIKLLQRIESPVSNTNSFKEGHNIKSSYILLDPLAKFAVIFAALIHDVDHYGVSNIRLIEEETPIAKRYKGKSVAEQNSVDVAWNLLMQPDFFDLQQSIFSTEVDQKRFRQLIVNSVLATDIFDKDLRLLRDSRWEKAFCSTSDLGVGLNYTPDDANRRATVVIEHLIQASDVVHTMQHWTIYQKWNSRLFQEMYVAYMSGKAKKDPTEGWYEGELWFFDNYIIPLAKKLKICGVFGVSCDEFLDYALDNRLEWEQKGQQLTQDLKKKAQSYCKDNTIM